MSLVLLHRIIQNENDAIQTDIETITPITHVQLILDLNIHQIP